MRLLDRPVRPKPDYFGPDGAPPGIELRLDAYTVDVNGRPWYQTRPTIKPRLIIAHTNGANREASVEASVRYGNISRNYTKPTYHLGDKPAKCLRSDLRCIANSTPAHLEGVHGDVSFFSIAIESADWGKYKAIENGVDWPTDCGPWLYDNADDLAHIIAYEAMVHGIPIRVPSEWYGEGIVAHTEPFPEHYTIYPGKTCPGRTKKRTLFDEIIPRAQQIRAAWTATTQPPEVIDPPTEDDMATYVRYANWADQFMAYAVSAETKKRNGDQHTEAGVLPAVSREEFVAIHNYEPTPLKG